MRMHTHSFHGRNVNHILPTAVAMFREGWNTIPLVSRGGQRTTEHNGLVTTTYMNPCERVLFDHHRDANPFFHFFEALWILAGREDVKWLSFFLGNIKKYSDDGATFHGAYGARLRNHFLTHDEGDEQDQLKWVVQHLHNDPNSRRALLGMFDPAVDHEERSLDIPCNVALDFLIRNGALHLSVFNRSNDMVWGAYGANVVQFSTILEYVAGCLGIPVGTYTQVSNSFHVYEDEPAWQRIRDNVRLMNIVCPYDDNLVKPYDMFTGISAHDDNLKPNERQARWDAELQVFMRETQSVMNSAHRKTEKAVFSVPYFSEVAVPLFNSFMGHKVRKNPNEALLWSDLCQATDWRKAAQEWLQRRAQHAG